MYLDNAEEIINMQQYVTKPPDYVRYTVILFSLWLKWTEEYNQQRMETEHTLSQNIQQTNITPLGTKIGPPWMKIEFKNLEEFYNYYYKLLGVKNG